ncbi:MAG: glycerophosphodiester phosphodiesterase family protein [Caldicoprobacterales bacterium]|jgi:glycerophosphoryl diester phosphodiesterase|nr:glycerophosphodiester phosphodiesterase [Clostridiales bacterium]
MKKNFGKSILVFLVLLAAFIWLNNTNLFDSGEGNYKFLAHRGLAQTFDVSKVEWDTNTAEIIYEPEHPYLENTIESIQTAFDLGADVVEFDVRLTKDRKLAVFHDFALEYRTDGTGEVSDYTMDELKKLDIGYGYTADNGQTYPFRGKGTGLMPDIDEVFAAFPDKELLINVKDGNLETYEVLWNDYLSTKTAERLAQLTVYGDDAGIELLREKSPSLRLLSVSMMKSALLQYELIGFTGYIPKDLHNMELHLPLKYAKFLWGWPNKFIKRMESVNTRVVIVAGNGKWSEGFDTEESLLTIPDGYNGYIWTNRIDQVNKR